MNPVLSFDNIIGLIPKLFKCTMCLNLPKVYLRVLEIPKPVLHRLNDRACICS